MAKRINILILEENLAIIDKYAAAAKMSRSAYISKTCIDKPPIIISGAEEIVQLLGKCYADKRISRSNSSKRYIDQILDAFTRIIDKLNELNNGSSEHYIESDNSEETAESDSYITYGPEKSFEPKSKNNIDVYVSADEDETELVWE